MVRRLQHLTDRADRVIRLARAMAGQATAVGQAGRWGRVGRIRCNRLSRLNSDSRQRRPSLRHHTTRQATDPSSLPSRLPLLRPRMAILTRCLPVRRSAAIRTTATITVRTSPRCSTRLYREVIRIAPWRLVKRRRMALDQQVSRVGRDKAKGKATGLKGWASWVTRRERAFRDPSHLLVRPRDNHRTPLCSSSNSRRRRRRRRKVMGKVEGARDISGEASSMGRSA